MPSMPCWILFRFIRNFTFCSQMNCEKFMEAGHQENVPLTSCQPSQTLVFTITLPMSKTDFIASEERYIQSIATTARISRGGVKIISIDEIPYSSSRKMALSQGLRLLLATAVRVETSVTLISGQPTYIQNETLLNANLNSNGLPSCTLVIHSPQTTISQLSSTAVPNVDSQANKTPGSALILVGAGTPQPEAASSSSSSLSMGAILGIVLGCVVLGLSLVFFLARLRLSRQTRSRNPDQETMACRYMQTEEEILCSGRPLHLFGEDHVPSFNSIKECILHAIPEFPRKIADLIEETVRLHLAADIPAKTCIQRYNLTRLEAEAICWWSADVGTISEMTSDKSPYYVYNTALRQRNASRIKLWKDFSYHFINGLQKLPPTKADSFRGENKRVTTLSKRYVKDNTVRLKLASSVCISTLSKIHGPVYDQVVWIGFTSTTLDRQNTLSQFGTGGTFFKLKVLNGRNIKDLSLFPREQELLLLPNSNFVVETAIPSEQVSIGVRCFKRSMIKEV
jgi:hypothetical protein